MKQLGLAVVRWVDCWQEEGVKVVYLRSVCTVFWPTVKWMNYGWTTELMACNNADCIMVTYKMQTVVDEDICGTVRMHVLESMKTRRNPDCKLIMLSSTRIHWRNIIFITYLEFSYTWTHHEHKYWAKVLNLLYFLLFPLLCRGDENNIVIFMPSFWSV